METRRISTPRLLYNHILTWCFAPSSIRSTLHSRKNSVSIKSSIIEVLKTKYQFSSECGWKAIYLSNIKMIKIFFVCLTCLPHKCEYFQASILFTQSFRPFRNPKAISFFKSPKHWKSVAPDRNFQSGQKIWPCCIVPTGQWTLWLFPSKDFSIYICDDCIIITSTTASQRFFWQEKLLFVSGTFLWQGPIFLPT